MASNSDSERPAFSPTPSRNQRPKGKERLRTYSRNNYEGTPLLDTPLISAGPAPTTARRTAVVRQPTSGLRNRDIDAATTPISAESAPTTASARLPDSHGFTMPQMEMNDDEGIVSPVSTGSTSTLASSSTMGQQRASTSNLGDVDAVGADVSQLATPTVASSAVTCPSASQPTAPKKIKSPRNPHVCRVWLEHGQCARQYVDCELTHHVSRQAGVNLETNRRNMWLLLQLGDQLQWDPTFSWKKIMASYPNVFTQSESRTRGRYFEMKGGIRKKNGTPISTALPPTEASASDVGQSASQLSRQKRRRNDAHEPASLSHKKRKSAVSTSPSPTVATGAATDQPASEPIVQRKKRGDGGPQDDATLASVSAPFLPTKASRATADQPASQRPRQRRERGDVPSASASRDQETLDVAAIMVQLAQGMIGGTAQTQTAAWHREGTKEKRHHFLLQVVNEHYAALAPEPPERIVRMKGGMSNSLLSREISGTSVRALHPQLASKDCPDGSPENGTPGPGLP